MWHSKVHVGVAKKITMCFARGYFRQFQILVYSPVPYKIIIIILIIIIIIINFFLTLDHYLATNFYYSYIGKFPTSSL